MTMTRFKSARGTAMLEVALTLPLVLLVAVGIFEFGRAYETMQVLTNAAREGARVAVLPNQQPDAVKTRVNAYLASGGLNTCDPCIAVTATQISIGGASTASGSKVTVNYPFSFMVLQPVARLVVGNSTLGSAFTMSAVAEMRNEQ
jgi:Flp pilus assembly protein TadG